MPTLKLYLLGSPRVEVDDVRVELKPRKALALLIYLALTGEYQSRDTLATLFWPEASQRDARAALRRRLSELVGALKGGWLESDSESVRLAAGPDLWLDVAEFWQKLEQYKRHGHALAELCPACVSALTEAVALYRGDFLSGFTLPDCPGFDEWQFFQTESLRQAQASVLERLVLWLSAQGELAAAIAHSRAWLALDPLHELVHRHLMQLYAHLGQRAAALRQYEECQRLLAEALGVSPDEETQALYAELRGNTRGTLFSVQRPETTVAASSLPPIWEEATSPAVLPSVFVGRTDELMVLSAALESARAGKGQVRFVTGGAGQGKSMLVQELVGQAQAADLELLAIIGHCNAYTGIGDPYLPFREALALLAGEVEAKWAGGWLSASAARRLWSALPITLPALVEHAPDLIGPFVAARSLLARASAITSHHAPWVKQLASLSTSTRAMPLEERRIFSQYTAVLKAIAARQPLLLILEDLHWVDLSSSGLLFHLSRAVADSRILIVGTYRPEEVVLRPRGLPGAGISGARHPMADMVSEFKRQHGAIWLDLGDQTALERRQFVEDYVDTQPNQLGVAFRAALFQHTGGHALFTVELLHALQVRGDLSQDQNGQWVAGKHIDWQLLPAKVEGVIEKQLARLHEDAFGVLRVACVQGESFAAEIIARVVQIDEQMVVQKLSQELSKQHRLVSAQEVVWLGQQPLSHYRFRHYLFQHYLYQSLDVMERTYLHQAVGSALEALYGEESSEIAVQLAHHFQQAGLKEKAVNALLRAGRRAQQLGAHQEAIQHLTHGLTLLRTLPETLGRSRQELDYLLGLVIAMDEAGNYDTYELERILLRARTLCEQLGESTDLSIVIHYLSSVDFARGEYRQCLAYAEEQLQLGLRLPNAEPRLLSSLGLGIFLQITGDFTTSATYLERFLTQYDPNQHYDFNKGYSGIDKRVLALEHLALHALVSGYPDQALKHDEAALQMAAALRHSNTLAMALFMSAGLHETRRDWYRMITQVAAVIRLATEYSFFFLLSHTRIYEGCILIEQGQAEAGLALQLQGISELHTYRQTKTPAYFASILAKGYVVTGQSQMGLEIIDKALARVEQSGEHWFDAELYRLKGELLQIDGGSITYVEECFDRAIEIARHQQAKLWELRATVSLCKLWQNQGKSAAAHMRLAELYGWFSEGFDTPDLLEAKTLLAALA